MVSRWITKDVDQPFVKLTPLWRGFTNPVPDYRSLSTTDQAARNFKTRCVLDLGLSYR